MHLYLMSIQKLQIRYEFYATNDDIADDISCMLMDYEIGQDYYDAKKALKFVLIA